MSSKKRAWIIAIFISLFAGPAAAYYTFREDPQISKLRNLREKSRDKELSDADRAKYRQESEAAWNDLGPEKQVSYMRRRSDPEQEQKWSERFNKNMDEFFALDDKEKKKKLQEEIRAEEKRAKEYEAAKAKEEAANALAQNSSGGTSGLGGANGQANQSGQNGQGGRGGGGGGGGRGSFRNMSPQQQRLQLDYGSSSSRAKMAERSREKQVARVQMGLPPTSPRGGGYGGRGGGGGGGGRGR